MTDRTQRITRIGSVVGYVVAVAGTLALVTIGLFFWVGEPWGTINDLVLVVMTAALAPLMLSFYELGGATPLRLAQAAQTLGWLAVAAWCVIDLLFVAGAVTFDYSRAATGAFAAESWMAVYIGLWIAGANLLAGPWLNWVRWAGVVAGIGTALTSIGLLLGGMSATATYVGGIGYGFVLPIWAFLVARLLSVSLTS